MEHVLMWIGQAGLSTSSIELELTESSVMRDPEATAETLEALSAAGVGIAIDDFGTGYSSLAYLKRFPLDVLKIDGSFVRDVTTDENDAAIVKTIIGLARHFGLKVVAEGVETIEHLEFLRMNGCRYMQGYYFARPVPGSEIPDIVSDLGTRYQRQASAGY
jgi:EAL domain-containing protein (putative c-di-GMP-specific phosphodiesterase class I)